MGLAVMLCLKWCELGCCTKCLYGQKVRPISLEGVTNQKMQEAVYFCPTISGAMVFSEAWQSQPMRYTDVARVGVWPYDTSLTNVWNHENWNESNAGSAQIWKVRSKEKSLSWWKAILTMVTVRDQLVMEPYVRAFKNAKECMKLSKHRSVIEW